MTVANLGKNCRLVLGDNKFIKCPGAALITDPPYGIRYKGGTITNTSISSVRKRFSRAIVGDDVAFNPQRWLLYKQVAFTGAQYFYDKLPAGGMLHCWDKRGNYKPLDQADADFIWVKAPQKPGRRPRVFHLVWRGICRHAENRDRILHPTQKPIALMEWIIGLCSLTPGQTIYDPYMGAGTTGIAAARLGFKFVGVELVQEYFDAAVSRLERELNCHAK